MAEIRVGETHPIKLGPKASDPILTGTVVQVKEGGVTKYLIDFEAQEDYGQLFGVASLSERSGSLQCMFAVPCSNSIQKQRVAKQLGF